MVNAATRVWPFHELSIAERDAAKVSNTLLWTVDRIFSNVLVECRFLSDANFSSFRLSWSPELGVRRYPAINLCIGILKIELSLSVQVLCDVIQSSGIIGGPYVPFEQRIVNPIEVVFCNPDLLWRSDFERPRLGQGGFKEAFQAVYKVRDHSPAERGS